MKLAYCLAPALLCGIVSFAALIGSVGGIGGNYWQPFFYGFLPGCFLLAGTMMYRMNRDISRLRRRLGRLEQHQMRSGRLYPVSAQDSLGESD